MKYFIKFIILFFAISYLSPIYTYSLDLVPQLKEYTFLWQIQDEDNNKYNNFKLEILWDNEIISNTDNKRCITTSSSMEVKPWTGIFEDWIFHLVCLLQEWKKYTFKVVNPKGIIIDLIPFISNKTLYTVWKEKYNDLQTWIASTNKDISLFSKKYQKIKDANFRKLWEYEWEMDPEYLKKFNLIEQGRTINVSFQCSNNRIISELPYNIINWNNEDMWGWILYWNNILDNFLLPEDKIIIKYKDWKKDKVKEINYLSNDMEVAIIDNCNNENSTLEEHIWINQNNSKIDPLNNDNVDNSLEKNWTWEKLKKEVVIIWIDKREIENKDLQDIEENFLSISIREWYQFKIVLEDWIILKGKGPIIYFKNKYIWKIWNYVIIDPEWKENSKGIIEIKYKNEIKIKEKSVIDKMKEWIIILLLISILWSLYITRKKRIKNKK